MNDVKRRRHDVPVLMLETGNSLRQSDRLDDPANRWVLEAFNALGSQAINTSPAELVRLNRLAESKHLPAALQGAYLASMIQSGEKQPFPVKPYSVQNVRSGDGQAQVRVGILAVSPAGGPAEGIQTIDPDTALKRYFAEVDAQSDLVVLLTRMPDVELQQLARRFPGVDVIVNGSPVGDGGELPRVGNTVIVQSAHAGTALGTLEVEWDARGHIGKAQNSMMLLAPMLPDAAPLSAIVDQARRESNAFEEAEARKTPPVSEASVYAGVGECKDCHEKAYDVWLKSGHAHALDTLKRAGNEYNKECLECHVTGFDIERGFVNVLRTPGLVNVQCEACHGAAVAHSKSPQTIHPGLGMAAQFRKKVKKDFCLRCHTEENSPKFNFDQYWAKIAH